MVTPGLLHEASDRRPGALRAVVVLALLSLCAVLVLLLVQLGRVGRERDLLSVQLDSLTKAPVTFVSGEEERKVQALQAKVRELEAALDKPAPPPPPDPAPAPPRSLRVLPETQAAERLTQGLHELRSGRVLQAELCFFRALPEGFLPLVMTAVLRGEPREAVVFLFRAMAADPDWLRRFRPRDLFGTPEEYERALKAVEEHAGQNPLDADAKVLLAYFHHHEKGAAHAKALLVEATTLQPGHGEARGYLEVVDRN